MMDRGTPISYMGFMSTSKAGSRATFSQLGGWRGLLRNPGLFLHTLRRGAYVGQDELGNQYFESPGLAGSFRNRRWVIYAGAPEASSIGPRWHSWLHHLTDQPLPDSGDKPWQKPHLPNLTGTEASYRPAGHDYMGGQRAKASADYEAWTPEQS